MTQIPENLTFESNLAQLQSMVERLELESLGLEESLELFEQGMKLAQVCDAQLKAAESRVQVLVTRDTDLNLRSELALEPVTVDESKE